MMLYSTDICYYAVDMRVFRIFADRKRYVMRGTYHAYIGASTIACATALVPSILPPSAFLVSMAAGVFGALLPDIDSETSILGRYVYIPVEHRTITHALWIPLGLFVLGATCYIGGFWSVTWLSISLGWLSHLVVDSWSRAGICWWWPRKRYIHYESGAFVAPGHYMKLYRNNSDEETFLCVVICTILWLVVIVL